jgi:glutathione peroxidase-family protein
MSMSYIRHTPERVVIQFYNFTISSAFFSSSRREGGWYIFAMPRFISHALGQRIMSKSNWALCLLLSFAELGSAAGFAHVHSPSQSLRMGAELPRPSRGAALVGTRLDFFAGVGGLGLAVAGFPALASDGAEQAPSGPEPSALDFSLAFNNKQTPMSKLLGPKATLIINGKLDDPASQQQMPAIVQAVQKYGPQGLHILIVPSDQGYFEPDEDRVVKIKFFQFHGFGQYPVATVVDKTDIVGNTAHPLYKYLCRTLKNPNGIGRITLNYEKFLLGADGKPLRRYPRRYRIIPDMTEDLEAAIAGKDLP